MQAGDIFGRWTVVEFAGTRTFPSSLDKQWRLWLCRCDCGTERVVLERSLLGGTSKSCGCYNRERSKEVNTKYGVRIDRIPEYAIWKAMKGRCSNPADPAYANYGGRGITVDPRWQNDFAAFLRDVGPRPSPQHQIDRRDNNLGYTPDNCRWATPHQNMTNRRNTQYVGDVPLATLAKEYRIAPQVLRFRILKGWDLERALTQPVRAKRPNRSN
jgi:hypothetical protein